MTIEIIINCNFFYLVKTIKGIKTIKGTSKEITSKTKIEDIIITIIDLKTLIIIKILTKIKNLIYQIIIKIIILMKCNLWLEMIDFKKIIINFKIIIRINLMNNKISNKTSIKTDNRINLIIVKIKWDIKIIETSKMTGALDLINKIRGISKTKESIINLVINNKETINKETIK